MANPTQDRLHDLFEFDAEAGVFIWLFRPVEHFAKFSEWRRWNTRFAGTVAGYLDREGYRQIRVDRKRLPAHRLIWIYAKGPIPDDMEIDHINGVRNDNRLANLRLVTHAENTRNVSVRSDNKSGVIGVSWVNRDRRWHARIKISGTTKHLGYFTTREAAIAARAKAALDYGFHPGHGKIPSRLRSSSPVGQTAKEGE